MANPCSVLKFRLLLTKYALNRYFYAIFFFFIAFRYIKYSITFNYLASIGLFFLQFIIKWLNNT